MQKQRDCPRGVVASWKALGFFRAGATGDSIKRTRIRNRYVGQFISNRFVLHHSGQHSGLGNRRDRPRGQDI